MELRVLQIQPPQRGEEFLACIWSVRVWQKEPVGHLRSDEVQSFEVRHCDDHLLRYGHRKVRFEIDDIFLGKETEGVNM